MYNSDTPLHAELPSSKRLLRSTIFAALVAIALLITVVLPAEYGIDPTGIGRVLRLTEMGEIKQQLAAEAAADAAGKAPAASPSATGTADNAKDSATATPVPSPQVEATKTPTQTDAARIEWRDEIPFTLSPGEGTEIKLKMVEGAKAQYAWDVEGGVVNFDTHADGSGKSISYEKGRSVSSDAGVLRAAFTGNHGWYWRNRGQSNVKVILRTRGDYTGIKK